MPINQKISEKILQYWLSLSNFNDISQHLISGQCVSVFCECAQKYLKFEFFFYYFTHDNI